MAVPTLVELAESGAHFGHHRSLTFPKARTFVFTVKSNVALIDLEQTQKAIEQAQKIITDYQKEGKSILFVGTKRSVRQMVKMVAESVNASYITERWFGGMLTNFGTMQGNIKRMNDLEAFLASPKAARLSKKDRLVQARRLARYHRFLGGISTLKAMPDLIVLASASEDAIAIGEANQLEIPVLAIMDTDMNPDRITYPIPANDDAPRAVELILRAIVSAPSVKAAPKAPEITEEPVSEAEPKKVTKKVVAKKTTTKEVSKTTKKTTKTAKK